MSATTLILVYSAVIIAAALAGGLLPHLARLGHTRMQLLMSLVSGLMLGVSLFHLLPHGLHEIAEHSSIDSGMLWLSFGLLSMFLLLRMFHFHQHDFSDADHNHSSPHNHQQGGRLAWVGVFFGLAVHTLIDGAALSAAILAEQLEQPHFALAGVGVFLAIVLHKPLDALTISTLLQKSGWSRRRQLWLIAGFALMVPVGALLFLSGFSQAANGGVIIGNALLFSAGAFLCISLSDLLPEVQFHSHDRLPLTLLLILGMIIAYLITWLEPVYHG